MNILHISPYLPSLNANHAGGVCMGKSVQTLSEKHDVTVLSFVITEHEKRLSKELKGNVEYHVITLSKLQKIFDIITHPWYPAYFSARSSFRFKRELLKLVKKKHIEAIHAEYASMGQYIWIKRRIPGIRYILTEHDFTEQSYIRKIERENRGWKRIILMWQLRKIHYWEKKFCEKADVVLTLCDKDKELLNRNYQINDLRVLNPYYGVTHPISIDAEIVANSICFIGQMGRRENYEAAYRLIEIAKQVKEKIKDLQVYIIGNEPNECLINMTNDWIHVTGFVEDIDQEISKCSLGVFPLSMGAGIKLKVLRCMALGIPVITTDVGAEGIDETGTSLTIAQSDDEFVYQIEKLLQGGKEYSNCVQKGLKLINSKFNWSTSRDVLNVLYQ